MLEIKELSAGYGGKKGREVLHGLNLKAANAGLLCIAGPNGCGKTTLLKAISGILPSRGSISLNGLDLKVLSVRERARRVAVLSQMREIYFAYTVYDTAALGRFARRKGFLHGLSNEDKSLIEEMLRRLDLWQEKDRLITQLSGGQLQRVFLARTLIQDPALILLDEPTNHLDLKQQLNLLSYLADWLHEKNTIAVGVLHDLNLARNYAAHIALMDRGRIVAVGKPEEALNRNALQEVYGMDVQGFMQSSLRRWDY